MQMIEENHVLAASLLTFYYGHIASQMDSF